jgi:hypothetical protein
MRITIPIFQPSVIPLDEAIPRPKYIPKNFAGGRNFKMI